MGRGEVSGETIRVATPVDVAAIEQVVRTAYAKYVDRIGKPPGPMLDDYTTRVSEGSVRVLEDARGLAGILVVLPQPVTSYWITSRSHPNDRARVSAGVFLR
jgi:hypothetical protein